MQREYYVRDARDTELDKLVSISEHVLKESPTYTHMQFDRDKTANYICGAILKQPGWFLRVIAHRETEEPVGGLIAICEPVLFGPDRIAYDVTVMVDIVHRGKCLRELVQVLTEYKEWALAQGAKVIKLGVSSGLNIDSVSKLFEHAGFERIGAMHAVIVGE